MKQATWYIHAMLLDGFLINTYESLECCDSELVFNKNNWKYQINIKIWFAKWHYDFLIGFYQYKIYNDMYKFARNIMQIMFYLSII